MARKEPRRIPAIEWTSAAVGLVITTALLGFLVFEVVRNEDGVPPLLDAVPVAITTHSEGRHYVVEVKVTNYSRATGAAVQIEGALKQGGSDIEVSTATVSYVPGKSERRAGLVFTRNPSDYRLDVRATGYEQP